MFRWRRGSRRAYYVQLTVGRVAEAIIDRRGPAADVAVLSATVAAVQACCINFADGVVLLVKPKP